MAQKKSDDSTVKLTGDTNQQELPAREVREDKAQEDNIRRLQEAKKSDYKRQVLPTERREDGREVVRLQSESGTVVTVLKEQADSLRARGFKPAK
jgi:precorrin-4 methylase